MPLRRITDDATAQRLIAMLEAANESRRIGILQTGDIVDAINEAHLSSHGYAVRYADMFRGAPTTLCFAVAVDAGAVVGIDRAPANNANPGRIWSQLQPWRATPALNTIAARTWAAETSSERFADRVFVRFTATSAPRTSFGDELLAQIIANPDDDEPRLVYADWLSQHGDPRGELIVLQCELAAYPSDDATHDRERSLLQAHRAMWSKAAMQVARSHVFRRGFITTIVASAQSFAKNGARLLDREPIEELVLCDNPNASSLDLLAGTPHLARIRTLRIVDDEGFGDGLGVRGITVGARTVNSLRTFMASPYVDKLRELDLRVDVQQRVAPVGGLFAGLRSNIAKIYFEGSQWLGAAMRAAFPQTKLR